MNAGGGSNASSSASRGPSAQAVAALEAIDSGAIVADEPTRAAVVADATGAPFGYGFASPALSSFNSPVANAPSRRGGAESVSPQAVGGYNMFPAPSETSQPSGGPNGALFAQHSGYGGAALSSPPPPPPAAPLPRGSKGGYTYGSWGHMAGDWLVFLAFRGIGLTAWLRAQWTLWVAVAVVAAAYAAPLLTAPSETLMSLSVAAVFFLNGLSLPLAELLQVRRHLRAFSLVAVHAFVLSPLLAVVCAYGAPQSERIARRWLLSGLLCVSVLPPPTLLAVMSTEAAGGSSTFAMCLSAAGNLLGAVASPLLLQLVIAAVEASGLASESEEGEQGGRGGAGIAELPQPPLLGGHSFAPFLLHVGLTVLAPLLAGLALQYTLTVRRMPHHLGHAFNNNSINNTVTVINGGAKATVEGGAATAAAEGMGASSSSLCSSSQVTSAVDGHRSALAAMGGGVIVGGGAAARGGDGHQSSSRPAGGAHQRGSGTATPHHPTLHHSNHHHRHTAAGFDFDDDGFDTSFGGDSCLDPPPSNGGRPTAAAAALPPTGAAYPGQHRLLTAGARLGIRKLIFAVTMLLNYSMFSALFRDSDAEGNESLLLALHAHVRGGGGAADAEEARDALMKRRRLSGNEYYKLLLSDAAVAAELREELIIGRDDLPQSLPPADANVRSPDTIGRAAAEAPPLERAKASKGRGSDLLLLSTHRALLLATPEEAAAAVANSTIPQHGHASQPLLSSPEGRNGLGGEPAVGAHRANDRITSVASSVSVSTAAAAAAVVVKSVGVAVAVGQKVDWSGVAFTLGLLAIMHALLCASAWLLTAPFFVGGGGGGGEAGGGSGCADDDGSARIDVPSSSLGPLRHQRCRPLRALLRGAVASPEERLAVFFNCCQKSDVLAITFVSITFASSAYNHAETADGARRSAADASADAATMLVPALLYHLLQCLAGAALAYPLSRWRNAQHCKAGTALLPARSRRALGGITIFRGALGGGGGVIPPTSTAGGGGAMMGPVGLGWGSDGTPSVGGNGGAPQQQQQWHTPPQHRLHANAAQLSFPDHTQYGHASVGRALNL